MGETRTIQRSLAFEVGGASSDPDSCLLIEEGESGPQPSLRRKGNLCLLAHGSQAAHLLRCLRDQYCGDPSIGSTVEVSLGILDSMEAAADLMPQKETGISCLAAVTTTPNRLSVVGVAYCRVFLEERRKGSPQAILAPRYPHKKLAMEEPGVIERAQRSLAPGDRLILCCGPIAQALGVNELTALLSSLSGGSPQDLADRLVSASEPAGGGVAVVIACRERGAEPSTGPHDHSSKAHRATRRPSPSPIATLRGLKLPLPWLLAAFILVMVGSAAADTVGKYESLAQLSWPRDMAAPAGRIEEDLWERIDGLWSRGQKGDLEAWREVMALLRKAQVAQPGELTVSLRLREAELNLLYGEAMGEVAVLWGNGETSARRVESWAKAVEVLEGLQGKVGGTGFLKPAVDKLYAARVNYGKALEAAGAPAEARGTYERARDLDPSRPEAVDALRRLR